MGTDGTGAEPLPRVLTVDEGAALYRVSRNSMYAAIHRGEIPVIKVGKRLLLPTAKLLERLGEESDPQDKGSGQRD